MLRPKTNFKWKLSAQTDKKFFDVFWYFNITDSVKFQEIKYYEEILNMC